MKPLSSPIECRDDDRVQVVQTGRRSPHKRKEKSCRPLLYILLALAASAAGCSGRYGKPAATAPSRLYADVDQTGDRLVVDGLVEFGDSVMRSHGEKGTGQLTITGEKIGWINEDDDDRSFSIRPEAVKSVTMECVIRAGGNVCLEMAIETITGLTYRFRDIDWAGGYNERIRRAHDHLVQNFPRMIFAETAVDQIR